MDDEVLQVGEDVSDAPEEIPTAAVVLEVDFKPADVVRRAAAEDPEHLRGAEDGRIPS